MNSFSFIVSSLQISMVSPWCCPFLTPFLIRSRYWACGFHLSHFRGGKVWWFEWLRPGNYWLLSVEFVYLFYASAFLDSERAHHRWGIAFQLVSAPPLAIFIKHLMFLTSLDVNSGDPPAPSFQKGLTCSAVVKIKRSAEHLPSPFKFAYLLNTVSAVNL